MSDSAWSSRLVRHARWFAAYGLATLVSASRFSGQKHFASDIVAGGVMGWFIGRHVFETH